MSGPSVTQAPLGAFRSLTTLRRLNVVAVGCSLAACTGAALGGLFGREFVFMPTLTTLTVGVVWALMLRGRATVGTTRVRVGWIASIPLAMANAALACALSAVETDFPKINWGAFVGGMALGASFGAFIWVPALLATLFCFGLPIAWSQRLADKGIAGEERGERIVGGVSAALAALALLGFVGGVRDAVRNAGSSLFKSTVEPATIAQLWTVPCVALVGLIAGVAAVVCAQWREHARRAFVTRVEAGAVEGYRVDATAQGKVLVRVTSFGEGYRVARFDEPLFEIGDGGEAQRPLSHHATLGRP